MVNFFIFLQKLINNRLGYIIKWFSAFIIFLMIVLIFLYIVIKMIKCSLIPGGISTIDSNGLITFKNNGKEHIQYLLPSSEFWGPKNGIEVEQGDEITIQASGTYHPAIHHLVEYGKTDSSLLYPWIEPEGIDTIRSPMHRERAKLRIKPNANFGELLLCFIPDSNKDTILYRYKGDIIDTSSNESKVITIEKDGVIKFVVNETILTKSCKEAYIYENKTKEDSLVQIRRDTWKSITDANDNPKDPLLWFEDNIGFLLITIEIKKNKCCFFTSP